MLNNDLIEELLKESGGKFKVSNLDEAYRFCQNIAKSHYENFPVASILLPKSKRKYIYPIYVFARVADDIADNNFIEKRIDKLNLLEINLLIKNTQNPLFFALQDSINQNNLEISLFLQLLKAFKYDSEFNTFSSFDDLLMYCDNSANPVGRLILQLFNEKNEKAYEYSDKICTALQLVNFWQDLSVDLKNNRIYIPKNLLEKYKLNFNNFHKIKKNEELVKILNELFIKTEELFEDGKNIVKFVGSKRLQYELKFIILGGENILNLCKIYKLRLLYERPNQNKATYLKFIKQALVWK